MIKQYYRPEIDGLRAIAVVLIILSHFQDTVFSSGGVNIFFVISGYLISHILIKKDLNLKTFFITRFLKLYPQLFIIGTLTFLFFIVFGDIEQWTSIVRSYFFTIYGILNIYLISINDIYGFGEDINPFLPFWAFCVIFQFYITFPFLLKFIFYIKNRINLKDEFITTSLFVLSAILFIIYFFFRDKSIFNFYSPLSRYWQFLLGSFMYFIIVYKKKKYFDQFVSYISIILIIIWQCDFDFFKSEYLKQLLLTVSSLFFLYANKKNLINKILSLNLITNLGKLSYPLYLIHLPVIYFVSLWFGKGVFIISIILILFFTFSFNNLTKSNAYLNFIEFLVKIRIFLLLLVTVIPISFTLSNSLKEKFLFNLETSILNKRIIPVNFIANIDKKTSLKFGNTYKPSQRMLKSKNGLSCHNIDYKNNQLENCFFESTSNEKNFILIGGSQTSALSFDLKKRLKKFNYYHFTSSGFFYLPDFTRVDITNNKEDQRFQEINKILKEFIISKTEKQTIILISGRFPLHFNKTYFDNMEGGKERQKYKYFYNHIYNKNINLEEHFKKSIENLSQIKNVKIILLYPVPEVGFIPLFKISRKKFFDNPITNTSYSVYKKRTQLSFQILDSIDGDNVYRVYPHTIFCNNQVKDRCVTHDKNYIFYSDDDHPSIKGSELINDLILKELRKIN